MTHANLKRLSDSSVQREIGECTQAIHKLMPNAVCDSLAYPGGRPPSNHLLAVGGQYAGRHYANRTAFLAAEGLAPSPVSKKLKSMFIERIQACEGATGVDYWLEFLKTDRFPRYVSDGNPTLVTVPRRFAKEVDRVRLHDCRLRQY